MAVDQKVRVVLVVDDEPDVEPMFLQRMRREIRAGQYEFLFAGSGLDALEILSDRTDIELVVTDLNMPAWMAWSFWRPWETRTQGCPPWWCLPTGIRTVWPGRRSMGPAPSWSSRSISRRFVSCYPTHSPCRASERSARPAGQLLAGMADDAGGAWWRDAGIAARLVAVGVIIRAFEARILTRTAAPGMVLVSIRAELLRAYVKGAMPAGQPWLSALLLWRRSVFRRWSIGNFPRRTILAERAALSGKLRVHSGQLHMKWTTFQRTATRSKTNMIRPIFFVAMLAVLLAVSLSCSSAPDVVRMGTEGPIPLSISSTMMVRSTDWSGSWVMSCAGGPILSARG